MFEHLGSRHHMIQKDLKIDKCERVYNDYLNLKEFYIVSNGEQLLTLQRNILPCSSSSNSLNHGLLTLQIMAVHSFERL
jgi:hypothetical protein